MSDFSVLVNKLNGLSSVDKSNAIQILILSKLKNYDADEVLGFLCELQKQKVDQFSDLEKHIHDFENSGPKIKYRIEKRISRLGELLDVDMNSQDNIYKHMDVLIAKVENLESRISEHPGKKETKNIGENIEDLLNWDSQHLNATHSTVESIIERIIESLDPESSYKYLDNSVIRVGPLKKAAMFDAIKEKYSQVVAYHEEGKMLRDFKVLYKQELKKTKNGS